MTKNIARGNLAVAAALAILISACSVANFGWLRNSPDVGQAFETLHVSSDYRYWYLYLENSPYAVLGLNREYRIEDILWTEVEPSSEVFQKVVGLVEGFPVPGSRTYGAYILDAKGERIGVWYSSMSAGITIDPDTRHIQAVQRHITAEYNAYLKRGYDSIYAAGQLSRSISANNDALLSSMQQQRTAQSRADAARRSAAGGGASPNDPFSQYMRGTTRMDDPYWGTSERDSNYSYHWTDGQGNYRASNDSGFNPNVGGGSGPNWQRMDPAP